MDIDRASAAASGALASVDLFYLLLQNAGWNPLAEFNKIPITLTLVVTKSFGSFADAS